MVFGFDGNFLQFLMIFCAVLWFLLGPNAPLFVACGQHNADTGGGGGGGWFLFHHNPHVATNLLGGGVGTR